MLIKSSIKHRRESTKDLRKFTSLMVLIVEQILSMMFHSPWMDLLFFVNNIVQEKGLVWDISNLILQEKHGLRQKQENQILYCTHLQV
jgi:hypothetical protein